MNFLKSTILLTGGTGSFGRAFVSYLLSNKNFGGTIRIFSRDEFKQHQMQKKYSGEERLRFFIGDVKDVNRLQRATHGAGIFIHAAALKQVPILEYNPFEAVKTNILGTQNVIDCAINSKVSKVILISSDKAVSPINLYGATKMVAEKIFVQANSYSGGKDTIFSVVRYGNVMGSRGSVVALFLDQRKQSYITITDERMTRFWITLEQGVQFVIKCLQKMRGGEVFVPKTPSFKVVDLAKAIAPNNKIRIIGVRPGEKFHEELINEAESRKTLDFGSYYAINPEAPWWGTKVKTLGGKRLKQGFIYRSDNNPISFSPQEFRKLIKSLENIT